MCSYHALIIEISSSMDYEYVNFIFQLIFYQLKKYIPF